MAFSQPKPLRLLGEETEQRKERVLFFEQPASVWYEALPVGNGRLGAMVFGTVGTGHIQLNEDSVWDGEVRDRNNPAAGQAVPEIRRLLFQGRIHEAETLAGSGMLAIPRRLPRYQTLGDLWLDFGQGNADQDHADHYRRELDLRAAITSVSFQANGVKFTREVFSSTPDQVIVVRLTSGRRRALSFSVRLDRPAGFSTVAVSPNRLAMTGEAFPPVKPTDPATQEHETGVSFRAEVEAAVENGKVEAQGNILRITDASAVTLLIAAATSHRSRDMTKACAAVLSGARRRSYAELRLRHIRNYQQIFQRSDVTFTTGADPLRAVPTDKRLERVRAGGEDEFLLETHYHFGRYLLISSSRPGTLAANLQGIWNDRLNPPWGSKYTVNINAEMNYWMAEPGNLADLHAPLFDLLDSTRPAGSITARRYYRARGFVVHHNTDLWGDSVPINGVDGGIWAMGAAWLVTHLWEHYLFGRDRAFLERRAYPCLRELAQFLLDYLVESPSGQLVTGPSLSPENRYRLPDGTTASLCMGPTMDIEITRAVFTFFLEAGHILDRDPDLRQQAETAMKRLPPIPISKEGRIQEWPEDYEETEPGHRHLSHLWALYPNDQITLRGAPELAKAARKSLERRLAYGSGSTGWSRAWIVNLWARLEDGDQARKNLYELLRVTSKSNLLDVCGLKPKSPFQIDGNLGAPAGVIEMLLQSHASVVRFLPALPAAWREGSFRGLRARGGLEADLVWRDGKPVSAVLRAACDGRHTLAGGAGVVTVSSEGAKVPATHTGNGELIFQATAGKQYHVTFA